MPMIRRLRAILDYLRDRARWERDLDEEIASYRQMRVDSNRQSGMSEEEARRETRLAMGSTDSLKESVREVRVGRFLETLIQDVRFGLRTMIRRPSFTLTALLTLSLGIGINTALFSIVHSVLMKPLPYRGSYRLAMIWVDLPEIGLQNAQVSLPEVLDLREGARSLEGVEVIAPVGLNLTGGGEPERVEVMQVSSGLSSLLGLRPHIGRVVFTPEEDRPDAAYVAILSHEFWLRRFGGDPAILGRIVRLDGNPTTIVGVLPEGFRLEVPPASHLLPSRFDLWIPVRANYAEEDRFSHNWAALARLREGVTLSQARGDLDALASRLRERYYGMTGLSFRLVSLRENLTRQVKPALLVLLGAAALILLIACVNVANLILARALSREREMAIRRALGAGSGRILRQLLTESILISTVGGAIGLLLARWSLPLLVAIAPALPRQTDIGLSAPMFLFCGGLCLLTGLLFGLIPALRSRSQGGFPAGRDTRGSSTSPRGKSSRRILVAGEIALSMMLVIAAGLMVRTFGSLHAVEPGFSPENVLTFRLELQTDAYTGNEPVTFFREMEERIAALPGVEAVGSCLQLPLSGSSWSGTDTFYDTTGAAGNTEAFEVDQRVVTPGYISAMGTRLLEGRFFDEADVAGNKLVAVVDRKLANRAWPGTSPVGKRLALGQNPGEPAFFEVVGVVENVRHHTLSADGRSQVYFAHGQRRFRILSVVVRAASDPMPLVPAIRGIAHSMDPRVPVYQIQKMEDYIDAALAPVRFQLFLLGLFAWLGLILAAVGITGLTSCMVSERSREIGIRITLGARPADILRIVLGEALLLTTVGIGLGLLGAATATTTMRSLIHGVAVSDPITWIGAGLLLLAVAILASYLPARRAVRIDPSLSLRAE